MAARKKSNNSAFQEQVRLALNHIDDPDWLSDYSPLAAPYFLGDLLTDSATAVTPGQALQQALYTAADTLWPDDLPATKGDLLTAVNDERQQLGNKGPRYQYLLLELRAFRRYFRIPEEPRADNEIAISNFLNISRASYFNHLKEAQNSLGQALLTHVQPTFRLEQPSTRDHPLISRDTLITKCLADLQAGRAVVFSGMGGVGKTAAATAVAHAWPHQPIFWFTFRPTFNDHLDCLLFSLGYFLHKQGASGLWRQLIADKGQVQNYDLALSLIRGDLQSLSHPPLFCLDELDAIQANPDAITPAHMQLREFIEGLSQVSSLLLIGQQPLITVPTQYQLDNLTSAQTSQLLQSYGLMLRAAESNKLHRYSGGNPRLLHICVALLDTGLPISEIVQQIPQMPVLHALWSRLWQRLADEERRLLQLLSLFRGPAPIDAWQDLSDVLDRLTQRHLIQTDGRGAITILPALRDLIAQDHRHFPVELREQGHLLAAEIRAARGDFTAAAVHYAQAHAEKEAVQQWFPYRQQEIQRGQGQTALALFQQISGRGLSKKEKQALALIRAELYQLAGEPQSGLDSITAVRWPREGEITIQARDLQGAFLNMLGYPDAALKRYEDGMVVIARLMNQLVRYRYNRGNIHVQQKQLEAAGREAKLALYEAAFLQGMVHDEHGRYPEAVQTYQQALTHAQDIQHETGIAQAHRALATTLGRQARLQESVEHAEAAIDHFNRFNDRLNAERVRSTLAATYFQVGDFKQAIAIAEPVVTFFENAKMPFWTAVTASTLAEAYYEVGQLDLAEQTAFKVLRLEENQTQPYALYTLGLISQAQEKLTEAGRHFQNSQTIAAENGDRFLEAYAWRALGESCLAQNNQADGRQALHRAITLFTQLGLEQETAVTQKILAIIP